jgi:hypothetical protein
VNFGYSAIIAVPMIDSDVQAMVARGGIELSPI